jgi:microcystin-dependent protein
MANYEQTRYDFDGQYLTDVEGINTGVIVPWTDSSIPSGFLECNGTAVSRSTYATLFAVIGTTYGSGNGSTTFTLPDLQDNTPIGKSPTKALASTGGSNTATSTGNIGGSAANTTLTSPQLPSHAHNTQASITASNDWTNAAQIYYVDKSGGTSGTGGGGAHSHNLSANFTGDASSVLQPYTTVIYIIKT